MHWKDISGNRGTWQTFKHGRFKITIGDNHIHYSEGEWVITCHPWFDAHPIGSVLSLESAKRKAIRIIKNKLEECLKALDTATTRGKRALFLDIDGVLCLDGETIEPDLVDNLASIVTRKDMIVLSSAWRLHNSLRLEVERALAQKGLSLRGITPTLGQTLEKRPAEIETWLDQHKGVTHWVVLDDYDLDMYASPEFCKHFVKTRLRDGLTKDKAEEAQRVLEKEA